MWGTEVAVQMQAWELSKEKIWCEVGIKAVTKDNLKIEGLVGPQEVLEEADMSIVF
jgi:hypothetical protein